MGARPLTLQPVERFPSALEQCIVATPALAHAWLGLPRVHYAERALVHAAGALTDTLWWLESGLVRSYYCSADGRERNRAFHAEGSWLCSGMLLVPSESPFSIEALEPTCLVALDYATLQAWTTQHSDLRAVLDHTMHKALAESTQREAQCLMYSPQERYQTMLQEQAELLARIPLHQLASYLGVSVVSMSRMRARMGLVRPGRKTMAAQAQRGALAL